MIIVYVGRGNLLLESGIALAYIMVGDRIRPPVSADPSPHIYCDAEGYSWSMGRYMEKLYRFSNRAHEIMHMEGHLKCRLRA